jgi:F-type H+-transporting ATPase subunit delta
MAERISRRKLAQYAARELASGKKPTDVMKHIAAYLIEHNRTDEAELVARDIETYLIDEGIVVADVIAARTMSDEAKAAVQELIVAKYDSPKQIVLREIIDESVIGGVKIALPDAQFDTTVKAKLEKMGI